MILFLHGPDSFRLRQKRKEIQETYESAYPRAVTVQEFDCLEAKVSEAKSAMETSSLFERKKFFVFRNVFQRDSFEAFFGERKRQFGENAHLVLVLVETGEIREKAKNSLYQWLKKNARQQEFLPLPPVKLKEWIEREFQRYGLKVTPGAKECLARAAGNDLWQVAGEVRKIAAWKKSSGETLVRQADVELFLHPSVRADVFSTLEAIAQKNKKEALGFLYRHLQEGDSLFYICTMLAYQFRIVLQIRDMAERGLSRAEMLQQTKLHPYVLKKGLRLAQNFSLPELKVVYEKLFLLDKNLKTGNAGPEGALDLFIAKL